MAMRKLLTIFFLLASGHLFAQTAEIYEKAADGYLDEKNYQSAYDNYSQAIKKTGHDKIKLSELYYKRGRSLNGLENYEAAKKDLNDAIDLNPQNGGAYWERGIAYDNTGDNNTENGVHSIADYKKALTLTSPDDKNAQAILYYNIALNQLVLKQIPESLIADSIAISLNEQYSSAFELRGKIHLAQQNYTAAVDDYTKAIYSFTGDGKGGSSYLYVCRAEIKTSLKQYKDAINDFVTALNLDPDNGLALWNRAAAYHYNGDYKLAADDYTAAMKFYKDDKASLSSLYADRASNELGESLMHEAIKDDSVAISLDASNTDALYSRANAYTQNADYQAGIDDYNKLVPLFIDKKDVVALLYYQLANNEYFLNQFDKVIADCTKAIDANPAFSEPYYYSTKKSVGYIFSLFYVGKSNQAVEVLNNEILATNNDAELLGDYYNMACLYALMNKPDEANIYLKKAIDNGYAKKYAIADEDLDNIRNTADYKSTIAGAAN
jgi:tetratricopeptide (TPR) repeat protein